METVRQYCNRAVLINNGKVMDIGSPRKIANKYSKLNQEEIDQSVKEKNSQEQSFLKVRLQDEKNKAKVSYQVGGTIRVQLDWTGLEHVKSVGVNIFKQSGEHITGANTLKDGVRIDGKTTIAIELALSLQPGKYFVLVETFRAVGERLETNEDTVPYFTVIPQEVTWSGLVELPHSWIS